MKQSLPVKTFEELFAELGERARTRPAGSGTVEGIRLGLSGWKHGDLANWDKETALSPARVFMFPQNTL